MNRGMDFPAYSGDAYIEINDNVPFFADDELAAGSFEYYSELDSLGRCGAYAVNSNNGKIHIAGDKT